MIKVPFNVELAKKITNREIEGRIFDDFYKCSVRIVDFNLLSYKGKFNVAISERGAGKEVYSVFNDDGIIYLDREGKLDEKPVFMLEIPEYMTFKDGDVLYVETQDGNKFIFIKKNSKLKTYKYVSLINGQRLSFVHTECCYDECIKILRFATESEKQRLIDVLKASKEPEAKECLKMLGIEQKQEYEFKPFDKVLARDSKSNEWKIDIFREFIEDEGSEGYRYNCFYGNWNYCIPYNDQTKHLLGTTENWEE